MWAARCGYEDLIEGRSMKVETEVGGHVRRTVIEHKGDLHPQIVIEDSTGKILNFYYIPERAIVEVEEGAHISAGTVVAKNAA